MRKLISFTIVSVDGYFAGPGGEIDWFDSDEEDREFSQENAKPTAALIFGRATYELMAGYWPTPEAIRDDPVTAAVLNAAEKIVFSKTLKPVEYGPVWKNVRILREIRAEEIRKLKEEGEGDFVILGSGSIVQQLANLGLIDEHQLLVVPVVLGAGRSLFRGVPRTRLKLLDIRTFRNGKIFVKYGPT